MSKTVYIGMTADIMHPGLIRIINDPGKCLHTAITPLSSNPFT